MRVRHGLFARPQSQTRTHEGYSATSDALLEALNEAARWMSEASDRLEARRRKHEESAARERTRRKTMEQTRQLLFIRGIRER